MMISTKNNNLVLLLICFLVVQTGVITHYWLHIFNKFYSIFKSNYYGVTCRVSNCKKLKTILFFFRNNFAIIKQFPHIWHHPKWQHCFLGKHLNYFHGNYILKCCEEYQAFSYVTLIPISLHICLHAIILLSNKCSISKFN